MAVWPALDSRVEGGTLVVTGVVQPSPITLAYRFRLTYADYGIPRIYVISPPLTRRPQEPDTPIPHTYEWTNVGKERPCVFYPAGREWRPDMPLATSVMPWLLSWLVDYEIWHATGEWRGGGVPHGSTKGTDNPSTSEDTRRDVSGMQHRLRHP